MGIPAYLDANEPALALVDDMVVKWNDRDWSDRGRRRLGIRTRMITVV